MNATSLTLAQDAPAESSPADRAESAAERPALRVALYTDADVFAGTERHMIDLARGLREEGADISVLCPSPSPLAERAAREHIRVVAIPKRGKIDFGAIRVIRRMLKRREIDIVHSHNGRTALAASIAAALAKRGVCVTTQHFLRPNRTTARGMRAVLSRMMHRWLSRHTGYFIAISSAVMQEMLARRDAPAAKISVVPNGMIEPVSTDLATSLAVRKSLGIASDDPLVVCVARLEKEKDIGTLIGAMKRIIAKRSNAHCVIAGEGTYRLPLEKQIAAENLQGAVHLLGFCKDTLSLIRAGDVFVLPSAAEPFGLVLLEAMWLARPVIATRAGGPLEIVEDGETGLLVSPSDSAAMARAIEALLADPKLRETMGQRGLCRARERFTVQRMSKQMVKIYSRLLKQAGQASGF